MARYAPRSLLRPPNASRFLRAIRLGVAGLLPCPLCRRQPASSLGVCAGCRETALEPATSANVLWLGAYEGPLGSAVRTLKYRGATRLAGWLGQALATEIRKSGWQPQRICAVPLHPTKFRQRGYNQAQLLAQVVAEALDVPLHRTLERTQRTQAQAGRGRIARIVNVVGAFHSGPLPGVSVLLVDDVLTTGATAHACGVALGHAGASEVRLAVVARAGARATQHLEHTAAASPSRLQSPTPRSERDD